MLQPANLRFLSTAADHVIAQGEYYLSHHGAGLEARWFTAINRTTDQILLLPESRPTEMEDDLPPDLRHAIVLGFRDFLLFYRYLPEADVVIVVAVLRGNMNLHDALQYLPMDE